MHFSSRSNDCILGPDHVQDRTPEEGMIIDTIFDIIV